MKSLSPMLYSLAQTSSPRLILALRPQDPLPDWITHLIHLGPSLRIGHQGTKESVFQAMKGVKSAGMFFGFNTHLLDAKLSSSEQFFTSSSQI